MSIDMLVRQLHLYITKLAVITTSKTESYQRAERSWTLPCSFAHFEQKVLYRYVRRRHSKCMGFRCTFKLLNIGQRDFSSVPSICC